MTVSVSPDGRYSGELSGCVPAGLTAGYGAGLTACVWVCVILRVWLLGVSVVAWKIGEAEVMVGGILGAWAGLEKNGSAA